MYQNQKNTTLKANAIAQCYHIKSKSIIKAIPRMRQGTGVNVRLRGTKDLGLVPNDLVQRLTHAKPLHVASHFSAEHAQVFQEVLCLDLQLLRELIVVTFIVS